MEAEDIINCMTVFYMQSTGMWIVTCNLNGGVSESVQVADANQVPGQIAYFLEKFSNLDNNQEIN